MKTPYQTAVSYYNSIESYIYGLSHGSALNLLRYSPQIITTIGIIGIAPLAYNHIYLNIIIQKYTAKSITQSASVFQMNTLNKIVMALPDYNPNDMRGCDKNVEALSEALIENNNIMYHHIALQESNMEGMAYYASYILAGAVLEVALEIAGF